MGRHSARARAGRQGSIDLREHVPPQHPTRTAQLVVWGLLGLIASVFLAVLGAYALGAPGGYAGALVGAVLTGIAAMI